VTATAKPEARLTGSTGNSPDTRHEARLVSLACAGRALIVWAEDCPINILSSDTPCREIKPRAVLKYVHHCQRQT
jgi:hypothetical protein